MWFGKRPENYPTPEKPGDPYEPPKLPDRDLYRGALWGDDSRMDIERQWRETTAAMARNASTTTAPVDRAREAARQASDIYIRQIASRMGWLGDVRPPSDVIIHFARKSGDTVHVMLSVGDKCTVLTDGADLFPSDTFVTKLRVLGA
jgi:hypothetical protein